MIKSLIIGSSGTFISRILGFVRSFLIVYLLGTGLIGDAYNVANVIPNTIYLMVVGSTFNAYFLPELVKRRRNGQDFDQYANQLLSISLVGFIFITLLAYPAAPLILKLSSTFTKHSANNLALVLLYYFLPQIAFYALYAILTQICNAVKQFSIILWAPVVNNVIVIAALLTLLPGKNHILNIYHNNLLIAYIGITTTLGVIAQTLILLFSLKSSGMRYKFQLRYNLISFKEVLSIGSWSILFTLTNQIYAMLLSKLTTAVNSKIALRYSGGIGYTSYMNSYLILMVFHSLVIVTLMNRVQPSIIHVLKKKESLLSVLYSLEKIICILIVPVATYLLFFGEFTMRFLFSHGNAPVIAQSIGHILQMMSIGLVPYSLQFLYLRYFYMHQNLKQPFFINLAIACFENLSIYLAYLFPPLLWKIPFMALCFTISYIMGAFLTVFMLKRLILPLYSFRNLLINLSKSLCVSLIAAMSTLITLGIINTRISHLHSRLILLLNATLSSLMFITFVALYFNILYIPIRKIPLLLNSVTAHDK